MSAELKAMLLALSNRVSVEVSLTTSGTQACRLIDISEELRAAADALPGDGVMLVSRVALQNAANSLKPPSGLTELRAEYWKCGAVAAINAFNVAIAAAPQPETST